MEQQMIRLFIFLGIFLLLTWITHALHHFGKIPSETTRKFLHVTGGLLALFLPLFFNSHWLVLVMCCLALLLLSVTYIKQWLPAVHKTRRKSLGSVLFPVPVYICYLAAALNQDLMLFYLPVSFLTISDTVAEWSGQRWGKSSGLVLNGQKSVAGSLGFAACSLALAIAWCLYFNIPSGRLLITAVVVTTISTLAELVSTKGLDNLSVPISALATLYLLKQS
jgi:phytol kinase